MTFNPAPPALVTIGARVKLRREELRQSQEELAKAAGISRTSVTNVEAGRQGLSQRTLPLFAKALGLAVSDLLAEPSDEPADLETPPPPEPVDYDRKHGRYIVAIVRCQTCEQPIERDGDFVKRGWKYWHIDCWPQGETANG